MPSEAYFSTVEIFGWFWWVLTILVAIIIKIWGKELSFLTAKICHKSDASFSAKSDDKEWYELFSYKTNRIDRIEEKIASWEIK
jgi:hypothetical protein